MKKYDLSYRILLDILLGIIFLVLIACFFFILPILLFILDL